ncbi:MAG: hypothetical protein JXR83_05750 [Deltaproteobacteria bacterium]|nr:hypothetical protein [Deltaproteobacteria bacterium]
MKINVRTWASQKDLDAEKGQSTRVGQAVAEAGYFTTIAILDGYIAPSRTEKLDKPQ